MWFSIVSSYLETGSGRYKQVRSSGVQYEMDGVVGLVGENAEMRWTEPMCVIQLQPWMTSTLYVL